MFLLLKNMKIMKDEILLIHRWQDYSYLSSVEEVDSQLQTLVHARLWGLKWQMETSYMYTIPVLKWVSTTS